MPPQNPKRPKELRSGIECGSAISRKSVYEPGKAKRDLRESEFARFLFVALVAVVTASADQAAACAAGFESGKKPNIVIIFTDDQSYGDLGCYGSPNIRTPNIDRMATEGIRFTSFYAAPFCGPSRAQLMTGCYGIDGGSAGPLREGKGTTFEGGMRVPALFRWPGKIQAGKITDAVAGNLDLLPTIADLASVEVPQDRTIDGRNLWPLLSGESTTSPHDHFHYFAGSGAGRIQYRGIRDRRWKLTVTVDPSGAVHARELYDLGADPGEKFDRNADHPSIVAELVEQASRFYESFANETRPVGQL